MVKKKVKKYAGEDESLVSSDEDLSRYTVGPNESDEDLSRGGKDIGSAIKKAAVVTKEELAKSGLSLRDYMNKQQGLSRRGGPDKEVSVTKTTVKAAGSPDMSGSKGSDYSRGAGLYSAANKDLMDMFKTSKSSVPSDRAKRSTMPKSDSKFMGMKKGGSVSMASKRGDGCATKGKTKGRMV